MAGLAARRRCGASVGAGAAWSRVRPTSPRAYLPTPRKVQLQRPVFTLHSLIHTAVGHSTKVLDEFCFQRIIRSYCDEPKESNSSPTFNNLYELIRYKKNI